MRAIYDKLVELAQQPYALWALALVSFVESSVFPIPPDVMLIPMILAAPNKAWRIAGVCTLASVAGGMLGYVIGAQLFEAVGQPVLEFYGKSGAFDEFAQRFNEQGAWAVLFAGITPFPYKVITITSGATGLDFAIFSIASLIARAARFFIIAILLWYFGETIRKFIEKYLGWVAMAVLILLFGGFAAVKYL